MCYNLRFLTYCVTTRRKFHRITLQNIKNLQCIYFGCIKHKTINRVNTKKKNILNISDKSTRDTVRPFSFFVLLTLFYTIHFYFN